MTEQVNLKVEAQNESRKRWRARFDAKREKAMQDGPPREPKAWRNMSETLRTLKWVQSFAPYWDDTQERKLYRKMLRDDTKGFILLVTKLEADHRAELAARAQAQEQAQEQARVEEEVSDDDGEERCLALLEKLLKTREWEK